MPTGAQPLHWICLRQQMRRVCYVPTSPPACLNPEGDASISTLTVPYSPFTSYVGINLNQPKGRYMETDKNHTFDVVTLNAEGRPVDRGNLEYEDLPHRLELVVEQGR